MIPIETEKKIRELLKADLGNREIARQTKVCHETVATIRKMLWLIKQISKKQQKDIKELLKIGLPVGSIEMKLRIPRGIILAVRRYCYLHMQCPTCGSSLNVQNITSRTKKLLKEIKNG